MESMEHGAADIQHDGTWLLCEYREPTQDICAACHPPPTGCLLRGPPLHRGVAAVRCRPRRLVRHFLLWKNGISPSALMRCLEFLPYRNEEHLGTFCQCHLYQKGQARVRCFVHDSRAFACAKGGLAKHGCAVTADHYVST